MSFFIHKNASPEIIAIQLWSYARGFVPLLTAQINEYHCNKFIYTLCVHWPSKGHPLHRQHYHFQNRSLQYQFRRQVHASR